MDRPVKHLSLLDTNCEAKRPRGVCNARSDALQCFLRVGYEGSVVHEGKVPDQPLMSLSGVLVEAL